MFSNSGLRVGAVFFAMAVFLFISPFTLAGSRFAKTYGGQWNDWLYDGVVTSDGGFAFTGWTDCYGAGTEDLYVVKLDADGAVEWSVTLGTGSEEIGYAIKQTSDSGFIVAGYTYSWGAGWQDYYVVKLSSTGTVEWEKTYGGTSYDFAEDICQTSDGGYAVVGHSQSFTSGYSDGWVLKLDSSGNVEWEKSYGAWNNHDRFYTVCESHDGHIVVGGYSASFGPGRDELWVMKLDCSTGNEGNILWMRLFEQFGTAYKIRKTADNGFIVGGKLLEPSVSTGYGLVKLDVAGAVLWQKSYGGENNDCAYDVIETSDGGYLVGGYSESFNYSSLLNEFWVIKTDSTGMYEWQKIYGGSGSDIAYAVGENPDNDAYYIAGYTTSHGHGSYDAMVLKTDLNGNILPSCGFYSEVAGTESTTAYTTYSPNPALTTAFNTETVTVAAASLDATPFGAIEECGVYGPYFENAGLSQSDNGNFDGITDPGETVDLGITLENIGADDGYNISGTLSTVTAGITVTQNFSTYPDIPMYSNDICDSLFQYTVDASVPCGTLIDFSLSVDSENGISFPFNNNTGFQIMVGDTLPPVELIAEDFNSGIPLTWTVVDNGTPNYTWTTNDNCNRNKFPDDYPIIDTDCNGGGITWDEELTTPVFDATGYDSVDLSFDNYFQVYSYVEVCDVDVRSSNTSGVWTNVAKYTGGSNIGHIEIDITAEAAGASDVEVRWHYYNSGYDWYWAFDNVIITGSFNPVCEPFSGPPSEVSVSGAAQPLVFTDKTTIIWEDKALNGADTFNVYKGNISDLSSGYGSCFSNGLSSSTATDNSPTAPGTAWFYIVTGVNGSGEGTMGTDSDSVERNNANPCL